MSTDIFISRQPVFDVNERVRGYTLAYDGLSAYRTRREEPERLIVDAFLGVGLEKVTNGLPAFLEVSRSMLVGGLVELIDPTHVVVELPATDSWDPDIGESAARLKSAGYRLTVPILRPDEPDGPLFRMADYLKVDVSARSASDVIEIARRFAGRGAQLLAANVPNRSTRDACTELGFNLFHGFAYTAPEMLATRDLAIDHLRTFQLMRQIRDLEVTDPEIEAAFRTDVSLSYKLLRMVNSAAVGARGIQSIAHALRLLGRDALYRWLALLLLSSVGEEGVKAELVHTALLRARLCELISPRIATPADPDASYIVGLLSVLDVLLETPMAQLLSHMDLADDVREALVERAGILGQLLGLVEAYDLGQWDQVGELCATLKLPAADLAARYLQALNWANEQIVALRAD